MAKAKKVRARNEDGTLKADDPSTPDVNEAWEQPKTSSSYVIYESREKEPYMFECADIRSTRNQNSGRCEWKVEASDTERFEKHHFFLNGRIKRKA